MQQLAGDVGAFRSRRTEAAAEAAQRAALQILCGICLDEALMVSDEGREAIVQRVERALKAERVKGLRRHWSYDLNRHIALKQVFDRLRPEAPRIKGAPLAATP